ncbi:lantibiotic dehydratase [Micromonospora lupini]|uniref:lantibiotic dehydratase n=1 Tax=Micromonospora lupini TaxID=285679 RepID=UPI0033D8FEEC
MEHPAELERGWRLWPLGALRSAGLPFSRLAVLRARADQLEMAPGPERAAALHEASQAAFDALLDDDRLRAAMTWQNPTVLRNWAARYVAALRRGERPAVGRPSRRQSLVARYAQRYAAKNETIGFFGPVAWVRIEDGPTKLSGAGGIRRHDVSFEVWAIQAVARAWAADATVRPFLPVRLDPSCTLAGSAALRPHPTPVALTSEQVRLVELLERPSDGWTVGALLAASGLPRDAAGVALERLVDLQVLQVGFRIPICGDPERRLAMQVEALPDQPLRRRLGTQLAALLDARRAAARDVSHPELVLAGLSAVDAGLEAATGGPVRPGPGLAAGGRTPLYLDCRADLDVVLGADVVRDLAAPLSILLDSARWFVGQVGETAEVALTDRYRQLATRRAQVTLADLQLAAADVLVPGATWLGELVDDFQLRWAEILRDPAGDNGDADPEHCPGGDPTDTARTVPIRQMPTERARRLADALFPATGRVWAAGRVHAPDLMLRRTAGGTLRWVLGELHVALNTLESRVFASQADEPDALVSAAAAAMPSGRVVPVYPSSSTVISSRTYPPLSLDPPGRYRYWSYGSDDGHPSGAASVPSTALVVTERNGELVASCTEAGWAAPVVECFGEFLSALAVNLFRIRPPRPYAPRIDLGDVTICRRTWRFAADSFGPLPRHGTEPGQDGLRTWAAAQGLPQHVFVRTPVEPKPFYVDFAAPLLVDNLARAIRRVMTEQANGPTGDLEIVEMLPTPDELWLRLPDGSAHTSELRLVAVDPVHAPSPSWPLAGAKGVSA